MTFEIARAILYSILKTKERRTKMGSFKRVKAACYTVNVCMAITGNLSPLLFLTFRSMYGISYSLLGLLVLINFFTQLSVDLAFSFFSHRFNIEKAVKLTPVINVAGLLIYALWPFVFPNHVYAGLVIGTIVFSASSGFAEVLISPVIDAIPSENPEREMSKLHSIYAWGCVGAVGVAALFLLAFGGEHWQWLALLFVSVPLTACILFFKAKLPALATPERASGAFAMLKRKGIWLCFFAIFLGGACEVTMAQWCSSYLEQALGISKVWGDIFGVALFAVALGLGRSLYAKYGKNIGKVLFLGAVGAALCYLVAALTTIPFLGLFACAFTGFCVSMLWPGSLSVASERFPMGGVFIFAFMAAGGDMGAAVGPQLVGVVTDVISGSSACAELAQKLGLSVEQFGMKAALLVGMLFAIAAIFIYLAVWKGQKKGLPLAEKVEKSE